MIHPLFQQIHGSHGSVVEQVDAEAERIKAEAWLARINAMFADLKLRKHIWGVK